MQNGGPQVVLGLVASPGTPAAVAAALAEEIPALLAERPPGAAWRVTLVTDSLVTPPAGDDELVGAARERRVNEDWDLAVVLTDLPLSVRRRPVVTHASPLHGVAVVSDLGHHAGLREFAEVAWFASSLAMVGGALGAGLETDEAVRAAAYTHRPSSPGPDE